VLLELTSKGEKVLRELSLHHRQELRSAGPTLVKALRQAMQGARVAIGHVSRANGKRGSRLHVEEHKRRRNGRGLTGS
jgi:hypothetical protein